MQSKLHISIPTVFFIGFILLANIIMGLYAGFSMQRSAAFQLLYALIFWAALSWWFIDDSRNHGWKWLQSWGIFLYAAGWLVVPYYLFKTRGVKALLILLLLIGFYFGAYMIGGIWGGVISALLKR